jgi:hypothetical protein
VARSLEYVDKGASDPIRAARDETYNFLRKASRSAFSYQTGESLFGLLLLTEVSSAAQTLLSYYGGVAVCIRGGLCDRNTICEAVVPQIVSIQTAIARTAEISAARGAVGSPSPDTPKWTEADRLLSVCKSYSLF